MKNLIGFEEYVDESVWRDIHQRSNGEKIRKEDDIDLFSQDELYEYINEHYEVDIYYHIDNDHTSIDCRYSIHVPFARKCHTILPDYRITLHFSEKEKIITIGSESIKQHLPDVYNKICEKYEVVGKRRYSYIIQPINNTNKIINKTFIDAIEFLIDNIDDKERIIKRKGE